MKLEREIETANLKDEIERLGNLLVDYQHRDSTVFAKQSGFGEIVMAN